MNLKAQNVWYVSVLTGDDLLGDGSKNNPFASIQKGVDAASQSHGDTVKVAGGIYYESVTTPDRQGINIIGSFDPITWERDLTDHKSIVEPGSGNNGLPISYREVHPTVLDGFTVRNAHIGFYRLTFSSIWNSYMKNCIAENCYYGAYIFAPATVFIENSIFRNCERGIAVYQSGDITVDNCVFYNITFDGFYPFNFPEPEWSATVRQSTFYNCGIGVRIGELEGLNHVVKNNIIVGCEKAIFYDDRGYADSTNILVVNNDFFNNRINLEGADDDGGNLYTDPEFFELSIYDFHLRNSSPCIGAGNNSDIVNYDIENHQRPDPLGSNPDLGAYENPLAHPQTVINVIIDIKPGSSSNPINLKNEGLIPVAILTTKVEDGDLIDFDASTVEPLSVEFGPTKAKAFHNCGHLEDVDGDENLDMLLHFATQETCIQFGDIEASLNGMTNSGQQIIGTDSIQTIGFSLPKELIKRKDDIYTPEKYAIYQNSPNPFNSLTTIKFGLLESGFIRLEIFNTLGQQVLMPISQNLDAGSYSYVWDASNMPGGIYYYQITAGSFRQVRKMVLMK